MTAYGRSIVDWNHKAYSSELMLQEAKIYKMLPWCEDLLRAF